MAKGRRGTSVFGFKVRWINDLKDICDIQHADRIAACIDHRDRHRAFSAAAILVDCLHAEDIAARCAWFELDGARVKLLRAELAEGSGTPGEVIDEALTIACGTDAIRPLTIQPAGKPATEASASVRGRPRAGGCTRARASRRSRTGC